MLSEGTVKEAKEMEKICNSWNRPWKPWWAEWQSWNSTGFSWLNWQGLPTQAAVAECTGKSQRTENKEESVSLATTEDKLQWSVMHGEKSGNWKQGRKCESCDHRRQAIEIRTQNTVVSLILKQWENSKENTYAWKTQRSRAHYVCGVKNPSNTFKGEK